MRSGHNLKHVFVGKISAGFREWHGAAAEIFEATQSEMTTERIADRLAASSSGTPAVLIEKGSQIVVEADRNRHAFHDAIVVRRSARYQTAATNLKTRLRWRR